MSPAYELPLALVREQIYDLPLCEPNAPSSLQKAPGLMSPGARVAGGDGAAVEAGGEAAGGPTRGFGAGDAGVVSAVGTCKFCADVVVGGHGAIVASAHWVVSSFRIRPASLSSIVSDQRALIASQSATYRQR